MPLDSEPKSLKLDIASVESLREFVRGFPAYVAVSVAPPPGASLAGLRFAHLLDLSGCIGIEIKEPDGKVIVRHLPVPSLDEDANPGGELLADGENRRMLSDISQLIPKELPEGEYNARIVFAARRDEFSWSKSFNIKLRDPSKIETGWLSSLASDRNRFLEWTDWTYAQPKYSVYSGEISPENPLKLNLLLRRLFFGLEPLEKVDPGILNVLTAGNDSRLYEPETWALKAELYQARGDQQKYQECLAQISRHTSGLQWWIRMLEAGHGGFLKTFRLGPARTR